MEKSNNKNLSKIDRLPFGLSSKKQYKIEVSLQQLLELLKENTNHSEVTKCYIFVVCNQTFSELKLVKENVKSKALAPFCVSNF